ncbi:MAG TPA: hypothetical protein VM491_06320 [Burkholderiaceae bacterium]|nr:hypothetical protein [Burkholderiaceae bacterium]
MIQWRVLGMFVPSFFTSHLIRRFGVLSMMVAGASLLGGHVAIALSGIELLHFLSGLILLGVGWNFLFIGGTTLLTEAYRRHCRPLESLEEPSMRSAWFA